jgi:4-diphosphocytidyl-2-C-methyl-D-erythritol kinase
LGPESGAGAPGRLSLPAPGKLNLFLHVVGRRGDGYHLLETLFQLLDRGDRVDLSVDGSGVIRRAHELPGVPEQADLTLRAAQLLARRTGVRSGVVIRVHKRLAMGGGLGGGSSDAATVLVGLNRLWGLGLALDELASLGLELGADVPVFVRGRSALARGVGEALVPVALAPSWYLVARPAATVATAPVFADPSLTRDTHPLKIEGFPWGIDTHEGLERLLARTRNDCAPVVRAQVPAVAAALEALDSLAVEGGARMTGTGACVFVRFRDAATAQAALARVPPGLEAFVARGVDRSALHTAIGGE